MKRVLLALIPVALLTTASLALTHVIDAPFITPSMTSTEEATRPSSTEAAAPRVPTAVTVESKTVTAQAPAQPQTTDQTTEPVQAAEQEQEEPLPELVVDKAPLTQAMADLDKAIQQAKLAVTAVDAASQSKYIQETVNLLAGREEPNFRLTALSGTPASYRGVSSLLVEARVKREAAEVQWIAAVQRQLEAHTKRLAEVAQAGQPNGTVSPQQPTVDLNATVGPTGVLGTRGVRPEEQANELVSRAIKQIIEALRIVSAQPRSNVSDGDVQQGYASDEATRMMESAVKMLETAKGLFGRLAGARQ